MAVRDFELEVAGRRWPVLLRSPERAAKATGLIVMLQGERQVALEQPYVRGMELALAHGCYVVSYDMPYHGDAREMSYGERLVGVATALARGEDPFALNTAVGRAVIAHCLAQGIAQAGRIGVIGVSRGGYCGAHLMAAEPAISFLSAVAPVTDWSTLRDFTTLDQARLAAIRLHRTVTSLAQRQVWAVIGGNDEVVSTASCRAWVTALQEARVQAALTVEPEAIGHTVSDPRYEEAAWVILKHLDLL